MPKKKIGPMNVYPFLPKTNCGKCPPKVCMSFAVQLCEQNVTLEECPPLFEDQYKKNLSQLQELLAPPIKEVTIGNKGDHVKIGGERVLRRHENRYINPTAIVVVVNDEMPKDMILQQVKAVEDFAYTYIGMQLRLDMVAIRSTSNTPSKFEDIVKTVADATNLPLVLWSFDPKIMEKGLVLLQNRRPLLYAATENNWREMGDLAIQYNCPLTIYAANDIYLLRSLSKTLQTMGITDLALDVGCAFDAGIYDTINNMTMIRSSAILGDDALLGYPIVGTPVTLWDGNVENDKKEMVKWREACLSSIMIVKYTDLLMISDVDTWAILPLVMLRNNIYNDPRKPVSVKPELKIIAEPDENSPVFFTSNFALTYYTVLSDIEKIGSYLLVVDSEGTSVESAVAGRKITADSIAEAIKTSNIKEKIKHRTLIIPGMAARLKGEIEDATKWDVMVGPRDSSGIPAFLKDQWIGKDHTPGWSYK